MRKLTLFCLLLLICQRGFSQMPKVEVFGGYSLLHLPSQDFNGWNGAATVNVHRCLGITADFAGHYWSHASTLPTIGTVKSQTHIHSFAFGPSAAFRNQTRFTPFGHFLIGVSRYSTKGTFLGVTSSAGVNEFTLIGGGGLDIRVRENFSIRPAQLDVRSVHFPANWSNHLRYSAGVVFRWGEKN